MATDIVIEEQNIKKLTIEELKKKNYALTDQVLSDLKTGFAYDFTVEQACHQAGIRKDTYYRWLKESDEFAELMRRSQSDFFRRLKKTVTTAINNGNAELALKLLERRERKRYATRQENNLSGTLLVKPILGGISKVKDEELNEEELNEIGEEEEQEQDESNNA